MSTIGSNIAALKSLHNLRLNEDGFAKATERLSSGKRLNSAGDDAAGAAIVNRMSSQIAGMNVAIRNAGDAISMSQVAEGALHEVFDNELVLKFDLIQCNIIPKYTNATIFSSLLNASTSEHASRMRAMKAATENAEELIKILSRQSNQARQAEITTEISEIVGGAEALAG